VFQIKIISFADEHRNAANPTYLLDRSGIDVCVTVDVTNKQRTAAVLVWAFCAASLAWQYFVIGGSLAWPFFVGCICAIAGPALLLFARHVASIRIYLLKPGSPPPFIDDSGVGKPLTLGSWRAVWRRPLVQSPVVRALGLYPPRHTPHRYHIFVRETEPNAGARIRMYMDRVSPTTIRYKGIEEGVRQLLSQDESPLERSRVRRMAQATAIHAPLNDVWPLVRLCIGRTLYPRSKQQNHARLLGSEAHEPETSGDHAHFTFRFHLVPLAYWFLIAGLAVLVPSILECKEDKELALRGMLLLPVAWAGWALWFHTRAVQRWRRWVNECGSRPMGKLPIFLFCPQNDPNHQWEELDEFDFDDYIEHYALHTKQMFEIVVASFAFALVALLEVVGNTI
jgi:hypothetical protein